MRYGFVAVLGFLSLCLSPSQAAAAPLTLTDADGVTLTLPAPARRIVTLAPHFTDALQALGAGGQLAGVADDHEQHGAHARSLGGFPIVSDASSINYERILSLRPDLVLAWSSGTPRPWVTQLRRLGVPVFVTEPRTLADIAREIEQLGMLSGHEPQARRQAEEVRERIRQLESMASDGPRLRYFYQVWRHPLYSLSANHLFSQALSLCGVDNIVPAGPVAAPLLSPEFVLARNPDVMLFNRDEATASVAYWSRFPALRAMHAGRWLALDDKRLTRPGPGMLSAVAPVCAQIAIWRKRDAIKER